MKSGNKKIIAHTLVKNEARWIWFALRSVIDHVDEIMVWDTGSDDSTPEIVKSIDSPKIKFKQIGMVDAEGHTAARQKMLDQSDCDWILILDGDEIWYKDSLAACSELITHNTSLSAVISPFINLVGDIYHYQDPKRSRYQIGKYRGTFNLRFINRKIPGLHVVNPHGRQEYRDEYEISLQNLPQDQLQLVNFPYLHTTHLPRSLSKKADVQTLKRSFKFKYELGQRFPEDFIYPEVFYLPRPELVSSPWIFRSRQYLFTGFGYDLLRSVNFRKPPEKVSGY